MNSEYYTKRFEAVFLHLHPRGPKLSLTATARYIKKTVPFVQRWVDQYKREKNVNDQPNIKPNRASTPKQDQRIAKVFDQNPGLSLRQGVQRLRRSNINVSRETLRKRLAWNNGQVDETLKCKMCNRTFTSIAAKRRHMASRHSQIKHMISCKTCGKEFKTKWSLATHVSRFHR
ncbi:uncharacterized protein LOC129569549 [Sitodiplosis mosellana]|uniref:uncharacterized protein LOC129569549 n=1 Tax=Sitodiplosis mosellana TaxID=263140 RepID=UPI0024448351|nr:uncharacterized protein LOC129569549 [Sitodiplosis mosellana]